MKTDYLLGHLFRFELDPQEWTQSELRNMVEDIKQSVPKEDRDYVEGDQQWVVDREHEATIRRIYDFHSLLSSVQEKRDDLFDVPYFLRTVTYNRALKLVKFDGNESEELDREDYRLLIQGLARRFQQLNFENEEGDDL